MKNHKVIVIGLPKTGTSTLAVMLRMLGYTVNGPEIRYDRGDYGLLDRQFQDCNAFQDYPWCFEWQRYFGDPSVKYVILKRDRESWWQSFYESYGNKGSKYLSYSYMNLSKTPENRDAFLNFFDAYYAEVAQQATEFPKRFITLNIGDFEWKDLCAFLKEPLPKTVFGQVARKPHANKKHSLVRKTKAYELQRYIRDFFLPIIGLKKWNSMVVFLRKNNIYK